VFDPQQEYARRIQQRQAERAEVDRRRVALGYGRLAVFLIGGLVIWGALDGGVLSAWWLLLPLVAFFALGVRLQAMEGESARLGRAEAYYESGLARLDGDWVGRGATGERFLDEHHLYARDLDIFGPGSMFELLCQARTRMGEETLAAWLLQPAAPEAVARRREAVLELAPMLDLREDIAVLGEDVAAGVHADALAAWGEQPAVLTTPGLRQWAYAGTLLGMATLVAGFAYLAVVSGDLPLETWAGVALRAGFFAGVFVLGIATWRFNARAETIFLGAEQAARDVGLLAGVLQRLEQEQFTAPRLATLRAELDTAGQPPSRRITRLRKLMEFVYQRDNMVVRFIGPLVLWDVHLACALEDWRAASGGAMRCWLRAVGGIEALASIATYHSERPDDVFAEFADGAPRFAAQELGHPLLPADRVVANDVTLGGDDAHALLVSGSNMSGKSTLLRTVGVSTALAQAGVPVRAHSLCLTPLTVGASIRVTDSLQEGESRFYAEILRLRAIVESAGEADAPLLFLIDEFLHGTNSHDRRIGAEAIVCGLVERGAIGLVTTHDLALTHIADVLRERGANVHFEDHLENGKMSFDYRMRPGVVEKSNALELMRSVGLDV